MLKLRANATNRVIYINNPPGVRNSRIYMANELIYTFYQDIDNTNFPSVPNKSNVSEGQSPFEQWYDYITYEPMELTFGEFSRAALKYCNSKNLKLFLIIDHLNEYYRYQRHQEEWTKPFLKNFGRGSCHCYIYSASDNNEEFLVSPFVPTLHAKQIFQREEAIWLLHLKGLLDIKIKGNPGEAVSFEYENQQDVHAILETTGKNPSEISYISQIMQNRLSQVKIEISIEKKSFITEVLDIIEDYFEARISYYRELHLEYYIGKSPEQISDFFTVATAVDTGLELPKYQSYDKNLIYAANDSEYAPDTAYYSVCPAAYKALERFLGKNERFIKWNSQKQNRFIYADILNIIAGGSGSFCTEMRGYALQKLLIYGISNKIANKEFCIIKYYSNKLTKGSWALKVTKVDYFETNGLIRKMKDFLKQVTESAHVLYIPNSPNYGLIDCVLMNVELVKSSKEEENGKQFEVTLYLLRSTISIGTHEKGDIIIQKDTSKDEHCGHEICNILKKLANETNAESAPKQFKVKYQFIWVTYGNSEIEKVSFDQLDKESWMVSLQQNKSTF